MDSLDLEGAWVCAPRIHADHRGSFLEWFSSGEFAAKTGRTLDVAQVNCSVSARGVIRGIHFCDVPPGQAKYVMCASGAILDVIVDVRVGSPQFGRWTSVELTGDNKRAVFISEGLGHAFAALSDEATVLYLCSAPYAPGREHGVHAFDPDVAIAWPRGIPPVLSDKDAAAPSLALARAQGLLPDYASCARYLATTRSAAT